ncbi:MAG: HlyC/CorC family transporter [Saprospiraceae bacterium]|nr:HlyC/CorC family transporter [Saprospiraceae bacterium]
MEVLVLLILILINGLFSLAEMSLVSSRKFKLEGEIKKGNEQAKLALEMSQNPTKLLSTVQIGITIIGILLGIYSGQTFTEGLETILSEIAFLKPYANTIAVVIVVVIVTYISIVIGELLPKRIGLTYPERIAINMARPMKLLSIMAGPFVWMLSHTNDILLKLLNIKPNFESKVTEEEIKSMIQESTEGGEIQEIEQDIVERVFEMGDRTVNSIMTHRSDIVWLDIDDEQADIVEKIRAEVHSAYPVCSGDLDHLSGIILLKDLYLQQNSGQLNLTSITKQPILVAENSTAYKVLEKFRNERIHYAIVVDEYGATSGFITMDDLLDGLLGDFTEIHHEEYGVTEISNGVWEIDGQYSFFEFCKYFNLREIHPTEGDFNTLGGLFFHLLEEVPSTNDVVEYQGFKLEITEMDLNRILKVRCIKS